MPGGNILRDSCCEDVNRCGCVAGTASTHAGRHISLSNSNESSIQIGKQGSNYLLKLGQRGLLLLIEAIAGAACKSMILDVAVTTRNASRVHSNEEKWEKAT